MGIFGKTKKEEILLPGSEKNAGGLDLPPPPLAPSMANSVQLHDIEMPLPSGKASYAGQGGDEIPSPVPRDMEMPSLEGAKGIELAPYNEIEGLDKDWIEFTNKTRQPGQNEGKTPLKNQAIQGPRENINMDSIHRGPIFVEGETYRDLLGEMGSLNVKLHIMGDMLSKMDTLREKEETEIRRWHQSMEDMRRKLMFMDDAIFETGR